MFRDPARDCTGRCINAIGTVQPATEPSLKAEDNGGDDGEPGERVHAVLHGAAGGGGPARTVSFVVGAEHENSTYGAGVVVEDEELPVGPGAGVEVRVTPWENIR